MLGLIAALLIHAHASQTETIWDTHARQFISLDQLQAHDGDILVLGEEHAVAGSEQDPETALHHANQVRLIRALQKQTAVSVGMEFLTYTLQDVVSRFVSGALPEADFLKQAGWGSNPFQFYREQILSTRGTAGETVALNIPSSVASQVAKGGKDSLSDAERALLPPFWNRGNDAYFERFAETMQGHAPPEAIERYFWAQSLWDDTMSWRALEHQARLPHDALVIIVGEFHVRFGGGLPSELKAHGAKSVKTVLQVAVPDMSEGSLNDAIQPDATYGEAADYIWIHQSPSAASGEQNASSNFTAFHRTAGPRRDHSGCRMLRLEFNEILLGALEKTCRE